MKYRVSHRYPVLPHLARSYYSYNQSRSLSSSFKRFQAAQARASINGGSGNSQGDSFLIPGATVAAILMLGALHARRLYDDKKIEEMRERGIELEFQPDAKSAASAFNIWILGILDKHDLNEAALPLDKYASLRDFFCSHRE